MVRNLGVTRVTGIIGLATREFERDDVQFRVPVGAPSLAINVDAKDFGAARAGGFRGHASGRGGNDIYVSIFGQLEALI